MTEIPQRPKWGPPPRPGWEPPPRFAPASAPAPEPDPAPARTTRSRLVAKAERVMLLSLRQMQRQTNVAARRKRPPKEYALVRANLGRMKALLGQARDE